jgi:hypothetical protein
MVNTSLHEYCENQLFDQSASTPVDAPERRSIIYGNASSSSRHSHHERRFTPEVARAIGEAMDLQILSTYENLATNQRLNEVRGELELKLEGIKSDILRWMFVAMTGQTALLVGFIRLSMPHGL